MRLPSVSSGTNEHKILPTPLDTSTSTVHDLATTVKQKTKNVLHIGSSEHREDIPDAIEEVNDGPAFNSSKSLEKTRIGPTTWQHKFKSALHATSHFLENPRAAAKTRATRRTANQIAKSQPHFSRREELAFLEAHDDLKEAEEWEDYDDGADSTVKRQEVTVKREEHVAKLEARRESLKVAWITARHVGRVRAIDSKPPPPLDERQFEQLDDCGYPEFLWGKWAAHVCFDLIIYSLNFANHDSIFFMQLTTTQQNMSMILIASLTTPTLCADTLNV